MHCSLTKAETERLSKVRLWQNTFYVDEEYSVQFLNVKEQHFISQDQFLRSNCSCKEKKIVKCSNSVEKEIWREDEAQDLYSTWPVSVKSKVCSHVVVRLDGIYSDLFKFWYFINVSQWNTKNRFGKLFFHETQRFRLKVRFWYLLLCTQLEYLSILNTIRVLTALILSTAVLVYSYIRPQAV